MPPLTQISNTRIAIHTGSRDDYRRLEAFHFIKKPPATITRCLTVKYHDPLNNEPQTIGLLTESMPTLACKLRNVATNQRYGSHLDVKHRAMLIKAELRTISRIIIHPEWRNKKIATRLIRYALQSATTIFTEAISIIGNKSDIFTNAGMTAYHRHPHPFDLQLIDAFQYVNIDASKLDQPTEIMRIIQHLPAHKRKFITQQLRKWLQSSGRLAHKNETNLTNILKLVKQYARNTPVYYFYYTQNTITRNKQITPTIRSRETEQ